MSEFLLLFPLAIQKLPWKLILLLMTLKIKVELLMALSVWLIMSFKLESNYLLLIHSFYWFIELQGRVGCSICCFKINKIYLQTFYVCFPVLRLNSIPFPKMIVICYRKLLFCVDAQSIKKLQRRLCFDYCLSDYLCILSKKLKEEIEENAVIKQNCPCSCMHTSIRV